MQRETSSQLKWATTGYYKDAVRTSKYNVMAKYLLLGRSKKSSVEVIECSQLADWCSNIKRKISKGVWCDNSDYISKNIYGGHLDFIQRLGFLQSD